MPNWCDNEVEVTGPPEELMGFAEALKATWTDFGDDSGGSYQLCEGLVPMPEKYVGTVKGSPSIEVKADDGLTWYDWCIENWGTKWGDSHTEALFLEDRVLVNFLTPWGPPAIALLTISKRFPGLTFRVSFEEESPSSGMFVIQNGEEH